MSTQSEDTESLIDSDVFYVTYVLDTHEEATSLAEYLSAHGIVDAVVTSTSEVTISLTNPSKVHHIYQLRHNWSAYWRHHVESLFGLRVYVKE